jgi:hypothetical protein
VGFAFIGAKRRPLTGEAGGLGAVFPQEGHWGERTVPVEIQWLELWFLVFFGTAIAMSERRIALGVHATVSTMLRALGPRYCSTGSNKAVRGSRQRFAGKKHFRAREKELGNEA